MKPIGYLSFDASVKIHMSGTYTSTKTSKKGNGGVYGYIRHIDRETDKRNGCEVQHSNQDIDPDFTLQNESYYKDINGEWKRTNKSKDMVSAVNRRLKYAKEHGARIYNGGKNDTTIVRPLVVQMESTTIAGHEDTWVLDTMTILEDMFGKENIVGFSVHRDETNEHLHIAFVPVHESTDKKGNLKCAVSQTRFFRNPKSLAAMHQNMRKALQEKGYEIEQNNKPIEEQLAGYYDKQGKWHQQGLTPEQLKQLSEKEMSLRLEELEMNLRKEEMERLERAMREIQEAARKNQEHLKKEQEEFESKRSLLQDQLSRQRKEIEERLASLQEREKMLQQEKEEVQKLRDTAGQTLEQVLSVSDKCERLMEENNGNTSNEKFLKIQEAEKRQADMEMRAALDSANKALYGRSTVDMDSWKESMIRLRNAVTARNVQQKVTAREIPEDMFAGGKESEECYIP